MCSSCLYMHMERPIMWAFQSHQDCESYFTYHTAGVWSCCNAMIISCVSFHFFCKMFKMAALPRPHHDSKMKDFNNFWSQRGKEYTRCFSLESDKIPRRSSLLPMPANRQKWPYFETSTQNHGLPVDRTKKSKCANLFILACLPNFIFLGQTTDFSWFF